MGRPLRELVVMLLICIPAIAFVYWNPLGAAYANSIVLFQVTVLAVGIVAWYYFGTTIIEGATRVYDALRGQDSTGWQQSSNPRTSAQSPQGKFCRFCGAKIPRESQYCEECGMRLAHQE